MEHEVEKSVMFDDSVGVVKTRRSRYQSRYSRLSENDKQVLYKDRPDLDPENALEDPLVNIRAKKSISGPYDFNTDKVMDISMDSISNQGKL